MQDVCGSGGVVSHRWTECWCGGRNNQKLMELRMRELGCLTKHVFGVWILAAREQHDQSHV